MTIKVLCDKCGNEILRCRNKTFRAVLDEYSIEFVILATMQGNSMDICNTCLINIIAEGEYTPDHTERFKRAFRG